MNKLSNLLGKNGGADDEFAIDLTSEGISLFTRVGDGYWKSLATVPLQVGALARNLKHLRDMAGGNEAHNPTVEVWLPADEVQVLNIDLDAGPSMPEAVFARFGEAGHIDPRSMSFDFIEKRADGLTPVAGVPAQVLVEARDFLTAHGFAISAYTTTQLPDGFNRLPEFPLFDEEPEEAPVEVAPVPKVETPVVAEIPVPAEVIVEPEIEAAPEPEAEPEPEMELDLTPEPDSEPELDLEPAPAESVYIAEEPVEVPVISTPAPEPEIVAKPDFPPVEQAPIATAAPVMPKPMPLAAPLRPAPIASIPDTDAQPNKVAANDNAPPLITRLIAGAAVIVLIGAAAIGIPRLLKPSDGRYLPGEQEQTVDAPSGLEDVSQQSSLSYTDVAPITAAGLDTAIARVAPPNAAADARPAIEAAPGAAPALVQSQTATAPEFEELSSANFPAIAALAPRGLHSPSFSQDDPSMSFARFSGHVLTNPDALRRVDVDVSDVAPKILTARAISSPIREVAFLTRIDPIMSLGHFDSEVLTYLPASRLLSAVPKDPVLSLSALSPAPARLLQAATLSRRDPVMDMQHLDGDPLTNIAAMTTHAGLLTIADLKPVVAQSPDVPPLRIAMLLTREDPAMDMQTFSGDVVTGMDPLVLASITPDRPAPDRPGVLVRQNVDSLPTRIATVLTREDPSMDMQHFDGQVATVITGALPFADGLDASISTSNLRHQNDINPVRIIAHLSQFDPAMSMARFGATLQTDIAGLSTELRSIDAPSNDLRIRELAFPQVASIAALELFDERSEDNVIDVFSIAQPVKTVAPAAEGALARTLMPISPFADDAPLLVASSLEQSANDVAAPGSITVALEHITIGAPGPALLQGLTSPLLENAPERIARDAPIADRAELTQLAALTSATAPIFTAPETAALPSETQTTDEEPFMELAGAIPADDPEADTLPDLSVEIETSSTTTAAAISVDVNVTVPTLGDTVATAETGAVDSAEIALAVPSTPEGPTENQQAEQDTDLDTATLGTATQSAPVKPTVLVIAALPDIQPKLRPALPEVTETPEPTPPVEAETETDITRIENGVRVVSAHPDIIPPNRFGAEDPNVGTVVVLEATQEQIDIAALIIKAQKEGNLDPSEYALASASAPAHRPAEMVAAARAAEALRNDLTPSDIALSASNSPKPRPASLKVIVPNRRSIARITPSVPTTRVTPSPILPTVASVARAATRENVLPMRQMSLIGVYGSAKERHALVRTSGGRLIKVSRGDTVSGYQVSAISADAIRLLRRGKETLLVIPD